MSDKVEHCQRCNTWHANPPCNHNSEAKCTRCGLPVGYLWISDVPVEPGVCWYCSAAQQALGTGQLGDRDGDARHGVARFVVRGEMPMTMDLVRREKASVVGRLRVGTAEAIVTLGPDGYTGRITVEGYPMIVVIDHKTWGVRFLN